MNTRLALFELLETRWLMSAPCPDVLAAEPSEAQLALPAVQKVREAAARIDVGSFQGGVRVAAGDVNGDGTADIMTGAGPGGGPHDLLFDPVQEYRPGTWTATDYNFESPTHQIWESNTKQTRQTSVIVDM
jgi:hypothetical protein